MHESDLKALLNKNIFVIENYLPANGLYNRENELLKKNELNQNKYFHHLVYE